MSADEELGYVYLPISTPTNDYYGGHRPGDGLYGDSLVCIEAATGKKIWHCQLIRHGLWDYDTPAAPNLIDITVAGQRIKAVAQVSKQAFVCVFDRVTGKPVWPIEDRPVPASSLPGERASQTQPFPTRPAPIDIQGVSEEDVIDLTPELRREALELRPTVHASLPARHHPGSRCRRGCQLVRCCHRSRNWHTPCWDLPPALRRNCLQAEIL
jgi:quinoprotein glucose dehydrogenase